MKVQSAEELVLLGLLHKSLMRVHRPALQHGHLFHVAFCLRV